ncbi:hypothetical protein WJ0W_006714 [Paenibacillus melissococcoides]|uniref:Secreted protein n=1 Tax=Paenibacillus melissococcoides TaxID=2912268 RepID=A0ABN8UHX4_9BACL|nr:hypothetical protein WJ0W_006714 [Paenibacillus melissococcoides]
MALMFASAAIRAWLGQLTVQAVMRAWSPYSWCRIELESVSECLLLSTCLQQVQACNIFSPPQLMESQSACQCHRLSVSPRHWRQGESNKIAKETVINIGFSENMVESNAMTYKK